jgi:hypothetical protein
MLIAHDLRRGVRFNFTTDASLHIANTRGDYIIMKYVLPAGRAVARHQSRG